MELDDFTSSLPSFSLPPVKNMICSSTFHGLCDYIKGTPSQRRDYLSID